MPEGVISWITEKKWPQNGEGFPVEIEKLGGVKNRRI